MITVICLPFYNWEWEFKLKTAVSPGCTCLGMRYIQAASFPSIVSYPDPPRTWERGSGGLFLSQLPDLRAESDYRTRNYIQWRKHLTRDIVCMQCMGNVIITFFMPFDPAPCDKKSCLEYQTPGGSGHETIPSIPKSEGYEATRRKDFQSIL